MRFPKVLILIVVVLALLGLVFFVFFKGKTSTKPSSGEIVWWSLWEDESTISPLIAEYEAKNPKVKVKYIKQSQQDYRERLTNALAKGTGPDIFTFHNSWVPMFKNYLDPIPVSIMTPSEFSQVFYPVIASDLTEGSGILGIPLGYDALTLFINSDIFASYGKTPPTTWDDLRSLAIELTTKDDKGNIIQSGVALGRTENVDNWQEILALMMLQNGADLSNPIGKLAEDALTFFTLFSSNDGVWDSSLPTSTAMFAGGKLAMYLAPSWRAFEILQLNPSLNFKTVPLPQLAKGSSNQKDVAYATYWVQGVSNKGKNKTAAWEFLKFISSRDSLSKLYANSSKQRKFGEVYPRVDMASLLTDHPILGSIVSQAPNARSWYLQSRTFDGPTGINSLINKYFEDAVNAVNARSTAVKVLPTVAQGVSQILKQYGIAR
ncbi:MAG: extracellular solute-binding protein [Candidatus Woesebacteria bacterium]|nr:extracellular solute-binding protein [Candidatus Woesebacteria bacterium]